MRDLIKNIIDFLPYEIKFFRIICRPLVILFRQIEKPFYLKIKNLNFKLYPSKSLHQTGIALYPRIIEKKEWDFVKKGIILVLIWQKK